ncbi:MAG: DUF883 family protein [Thermaurantiacus tibetensis]|uniref:DUF883 family protein n=1 Tax=Thermaurantiacus tibetensis TaxID=2759035 RepID=UPI00188FB0C2|nr:DUF883 family protein [Thermaurantiacus tibetensis]
MTRMAELEAEAARARRSIAEGVTDIAQRLEPRHLLASATSRARHAVGEALRSEAETLAAEAGAFVRANGLALAAGAALLGVVAALGVRRQRRVVPVYRAYDMEDPAMHDEDPETARRWDRVRESAEELGEKAGQAYYRARSRAAQLTDAARDRAAYAADAAEDAARHAVEWTGRQSREHPMTSVIIGFALGAILAALLPKGGRQS